MERRIGAEHLPRTMSALVLAGGGPVLRRDAAVPELRPGEAIVAVRYAGICATDLQLIAGYKGGYRGILGHEFSGVVVAVDPGHDAWLGRRVVGELNIGCGRCALCRRGLGKHCRERQSLGIIGRDGAFAEYLALPVANLHQVPDTVPDRVAVFAEPLAAALQILEQTHVAPSTRAVVVGDGRLGQLIARVLALTGCDLTVIGRRPAKLALLHGEGIDAVAAGSAEANAAAVRRPVDLVVEATGRPEGFVAARGLVRPGGVLALKSTFAGDSPTVDLSSLVVDEIQLLGSRCGPFAPALELLRSGRVRVEPLISAEFPLDLAQAAIEQAQARGVVKVLLRIAR